MPSFLEVFQTPKPIIGMIHLAGKDPVQRALEELAIFEEEGIAGAIVENYHGSTEQVLEVLKAAKGTTSLALGVNVLPNEFIQALLLADEYNAKFIQLDHIAGTYRGRASLPISSYDVARRHFPDAIVLGGVWSKYYHPIPGSDLETDLNEGRSRAEVIVVTGEGTGKETPLEKIQEFRRILGSHPLIIGAGLTPKNAYEQLTIADGAIVGSSLKPEGNTEKKVDPYLIRDLMEQVKRARA